MFKRIAFANVDQIGQVGGREFSRARAAFDGSNSMPISRPPPLSLSAAARWSVEIPKEVPNSTTFCAAMERANV